ncbi:MAG: BMP family ABC transporter substrate-binding protein [Pseudomonadota bacterium]
MLKPVLIAGVAALALSATGAAFAQDPVALVIAQGGLGDQSYNDLAHQGFLAATEETGVEGRVLESRDVVAQGEQILRRAAESDFGLVVDLEYAHGEVMEAVAPDYPDTDFVVLNQVREGDNITSVLFSEHEGSYLAGALAAMVTTNTDIPGINEDANIGVIGGTRSVGIDKFLVGFVQGARDINPDVQVQVAYANTFGDPATGQQMAEAMFENGADIVYQVAGGTGLGVIQAAEAAGHYAIGVDTDQDGLAPGHVLTSMIKRVDVAVADVVDAYAGGSLEGGQVRNYSLADNGVGLSEMIHTRDLLPADYLARIDELRDGIIAGDIVVVNVIEDGYPDFFQ